MNPNDAVEVVPSYSGPGHSGVERRKHRRYVVRGRVRFLVDALEVWGELVNFGSGGMQIRPPRHGA